MSDANTLKLTTAQNELVFDYGAASARQDLAEAALPAKPAVQNLATNKIVTENIPTVKMPEEKNIEVKPRYDKANGSRNSSREFNRLGNCERFREQRHSKQFPFQNHFYNFGCFCRNGWFRGLFYPPKKSCAARRQ